MKLLLDQGLPRTTVLHLHDAGVESVHVGEMGLAAASDLEILEMGRHGGWVIVTLDADFHTLLTLSGATGPSVIRVRIEGLKAGSLAKLLANVLDACKSDLMRGAMVSVTENGARVRGLPLLK